MHPGLVRLISGKVSGEGTLPAVPAVDHQQHENHSGELACTGSYALSAAPGDSVPHGLYPR